MNIGRRKILLVVALAAVTIVAVALLWPTTPRQFIVLPEGKKLEFVGVTYGTNHSRNVAAGIISHLPARLADLILKHAGRLRDQLTSFQTTSPSLCIWFQFPESPASLKTNLPQGVFSELADDHDQRGGVVLTMNPMKLARPLGVFSVLPRRSSVLHLHIYQNQFQQDPKKYELGQVTFPNPVFRQYPQWSAETMPVVKNLDGSHWQFDRVVSLVPDRPVVFLQSSRVMMPGPQGYGVTSRVEPGYAFEPWTTCYYTLLPSQDSNSAWGVVGAELSDATGNVLSVPNPSEDPVIGFMNPGQYRSSQNNQLSWNFPGTFWPGETAWRLRLDLKRLNNLSTNDLVTFKSVPIPDIGATNFAPITNWAKGVPVVLSRLTHQPATTNWNVAYMSSITVDGPDPGAGLVLDWLNLATPEGKPQFGASGRGLTRDGKFSTYVSLYSIPTNSQTMDITLVVQKPRHVEFLFAPPKP
jgi:hypothetical protein